MISAQWLLVVSMIGGVTNSKGLEPPRADIIHATSGLILNYLSDYYLAEKIVTFSIAIPMVADMCHLIPLAALKKIPRCNLTNSPTNFIDRNLKTTTKSTKVGRTKRFLTDIISIGTGVAALALSTVNSIQVANLKSQINTMEGSLESFQRAEKSQRARMLQLSNGQLKLAYELNHTQDALNRTMKMINDQADTLQNHEEALRKIRIISESLNRKLNSFIHTVEKHFLHSSIQDILQNKLNLNFIHEEDLPQVLELIFRSTNISLTENSGTMSLVDILTRLLVRQTIHFIPYIGLRTSPYGVTIGNLMFTSFFVATSPEQKPFYIYKLVPIPFNHRKVRVKLAQMPTYLGINPGTLEFMRWSEQEATECSFQLISTCRETPPRRTDLLDNCLYQILTDTNVTACQVDTYTDPVFIHRVRNYWAISTNSSTKCYSMKLAESDQHKIVENKEITLPPTVLVTTSNNTSLICDRFFLPTTPIEEGPKITLLKNMTHDTIEEEILNLHALINNDTKWSKIPYIPSNVQAIVDLISETKRPMEDPIKYNIRQHSHFLSIFISGITIIVVIGSIIYKRYGQKKKPCITIAVPLSTISEHIQNKIGS